MSETTQPDEAALRALAEGLVANDPLDPLTMGRVANMKAGPLILKLARAVLALLTTLADLRARLAAVEERAKSGVVAVGAVFQRDDGSAVRVSGMPDGVTLCRDGRGRVAVRSVATNRLSYLPEGALESMPLVQPRAEAAKTTAEQALAAMTAERDAALRLHKAALDLANTQTQGWQQERARAQAAEQQRDTLLNDLHAFAAEWRAAMTEPPFGCGRCGAAGEFFDHWELCEDCIKIVYADMQQRDTARAALRKAREKINDGKPLWALEFIDAALSAPATTLQEAGWHHVTCDMFVSWRDDAPCTCGHAAALSAPEGRCEGRYLVPHKRDEPFDVTYRCALPNGHDGPHGDGNAALPAPEGRCPAGEAGACATCEAQATTPDPPPTPLDPAHVIAAARAAAGYALAHDAAARGIREAGAAEQALVSDASLDAPGVIDPALDAICARLDGEA